MAAWDDDSDFTAARAGIAHARAHLPPSAAADGEVARMALPPQAPLTAPEVEVARKQRRLRRYQKPKPKVFGIGFSRTGTYSLNKALNMLGYEVIHYPADPKTRAELSRGDYRLSVLEHYDGITELTAAPFFKELDRLYPGSKFILTIRENRSWLKSLRTRWEEIQESPEAERDEAFRGTFCAGPLTAVAISMKPI